MTVRVALDAMGGDFAPGAVVAGALDAVRPRILEIVLCGDPESLRACLPTPLPSGLSVAPSGEPRAATGVPERSGPRSSLEVACRLVRDGDAEAVVSAGDTGAVVATAVLNLPRQPAVLRPALAVPLPGRRPTVLVDAGAVPDATVEMLAQFGVLGSCYASARLGLPTPRVGLLNIGVEEGKGNRLARSAYAALREAPIEFVGNVEGGDLLAGSVDVVVTDGFTGNVALKLVEAQLGIGPDAERADVDGAAALVGLDATVLVAHGAARATTIAAACELASTLVGSDVAAEISERLSRLADRPVAAET